jgi:hypothetical protein
MDNAQQLFPGNRHLPKTNHHKHNYTPPIQPSNRTQNGGIPVPHTPDELTPTQRLPQAKRMENNQAHRSGKRIPTANNQLSENTTGETGRNS